MTSILGCYYSPTHWYLQDEEYIRRLDPAWVRIHQPSARAIWLVQQAAPNARIMLRSWDIDDNNGDRKREMYADPKGAARRHLEMWKTKWDELITELHRNNWQAYEDRWFLGLVNEPDPSYVPQTVEYTLEAMRLVQGTSIRLGVVASSVGTFSKPSENDHGWTQFMPLEKPINDGGHILIVHEYWQPEGPRFGEDAGNLAWRHHIIPLNVPILIGEAGANGYIYGRYSKDDDSGWQKTVADPKPETFAAQVKEYIEGCDQRVKGVCLYMLDFHSAQWWSFNTGPAMEQLLAIKDARPQVPSPFAAKPIDIHLPSIGTGPTPVTPPIAGPTATPITPAGARIRSGPGVTFSVLGAVPFGTPIRVTGIAPTGTWYRVDSSLGWAWIPEDRTRVGWVSATVVSAMNIGNVPVVQPSEPPVQPPPQGDTWARSYAFLKKWEGGYQAIHNDRGNWTGCQVGKGELKGTNMGVSACSYPHLDIKNLTREQTTQIFFNDYWKASGASALPWPACLIVVDTAVLHGVGAAKAWLKEVGPNPYLFVARRLRSYLKADNWEFWDEAWVLRVCELLEEIGI